MSISHSITKSWQNGSNSLAERITYTGTEELNFDFTVAASTSDQAVALAFSKTLLQSLFISSDQAITIKVNSSSVPDETLSVASGNPLQWDINGGLPSPFSANVTEVYISNAGSTVANVSIRTLTNG